MTLLLLSTYLAEATPTPAVLYGKPERTRAHLGVVVYFR